MIKRINELNNFKRGDENIKAIYRAETLIWPYEIIGNIDTSFNIGTGFDNLAWVVDIDDNEIIYVGGHYTSFNNVTTNRIVGLNSDGSRNITFNIGTGFNNIVRKIKCLNNKILIVGDFTTYKGTTVNRIVRLNDDGSIDTSFNTGTAFNGVAQSIFITDDNKYFIGGQFTEYNGVGVNKIVKLNDDGSIDTSFDSNNFTFDTNQVSYGAISIFDIKVDNNGKIIFVGDFDKFVLRLNSDGTKDTFIGGFTSTKRVVFLLKNDKIYIAGSNTGFYTPGNIPYSGIIRLNNDGSIDNTFSVGGSGGAVLGLSFQDFNEKLILTGSFTTWNPLPFPAINPTQNRIIRLNTDGSIDTSFSIGTGFNNNAWETILLGDRLFVTGAFTSYKGVTYNRFIKLL